MERPARGALRSGTALRGGVLARETLGRLVWGIPARRSRVFRERASTRLVPNRRPRAGATAPD